MTSPARVSGRLADMTGLTPMVETIAYADPQAVYRRLRAEWGEVAPVELEPGINAWLVMGYQELSQVLRQERQFRRDPHHWRDFAEGRVKPDSPLGPMMFPRPNALFTEGEEHRRLRVPLDELGKALPPRKVARVTSETCDALIDRLAGQSQADLMADYAMSIPTIVMGQMLGLDLETARELAAGMITFLVGDENAHAANQRNEEILTGLVQARTAEPADDMTSVLIQHPNLKNEFERLQATHVMVAGANDNSVAWIAQTLLLMLTDSRFSARLRGGRLGIDEALEEVLWRDPPMPNFPARYALRDTVLGGQPIAAGDPLILGFTAANADPRVHSADSWSELGNRSHLAWGAGSHICPAQVPARIIARTAVETALYRLPGLRLAAKAEDIARIPSPWIRAPSTLPVTFTPF